MKLDSWACRCFTFSRHNIKHRCAQTLSIAPAPLYHFLHPQLGRQHGLQPGLQHAPQHIRSHSGTCLVPLFKPLHVLTSNTQMSDKELLADLDPLDFPSPNFPADISSQGPQNDKHKGFLDLPGEIRNTIYDLVIPTGNHLTVTSSNLIDGSLEIGLTDAPMREYRVREIWVWRRQPYSFPKVLLHLNKMIHGEVCSYVYGEQTFAFDSNSTFTAFLRKISNSDPDLDPIRCLKDISIDRFYQRDSYRMVEFLTGKHYRKCLASRPVYALEKICLINLRDALRHVISMKDAIANVYACKPERDIFDIVTFPASSVCNMVDCQATFGMCREYSECTTRIEGLLREIANKPRFPWLLTEAN